MSKRDERIQSTARLLYIQAYEAEFSGKNRGRFQIAREDIKQLLGISRLHPSTLQKLIDACLELGMVVIDMDDNFAFAETEYVSKWRKLPTRLVKEYANQLDDDDKPDSDDDDDDDDD